MRHTSVTGRLVLALALGVSLSLAQAVPPPAAAAAAPGPVTVVVDGIPLQFDVPARIIGDRTMVPFRGILEALGASVDWDGETGAITAERGGRVVRLTVGSREAFVDGRPTLLDVPPLLIGGRTLVPARFVGEALGTAVAWDPATLTVTITTALPAHPAPTARPAEPAPAPLSISVDGPVPETAIRQVEVALPQLWAEVAGLLKGPEAAGAIPRVTLLSDRDRYLRHLLAQGTRPEVAVQIATHAAGSANAQAVAILADAADRDYRRILAHELGHVAILRRGLGPKLPEWLHEGLVEYVAQALTVGDPRTPLGSRYWAGVRRRVLELAAQGSLEPLFEAYGQWIDRFDDYPAHDQAMLAVTLLAERWGGMPALTRYLDRLAFEEHPTAFQAAFGIAAGDFQQLFTGYLYGQAQRTTPRLTAVLRIPDGFRGELTVFAPGSTRTPGWRVTGPASITVTVDPAGSVHVGGPVARGGTWTISAGRPYLVIFAVPDAPVDYGGRRVTQAAIFLQAEYGAWSWLNNAASFTEGEPDTSATDPAYPLGVELVELGG